MTRQRTSAPRGLQAMYDTFCAICDHAIRQGDPIAHNRGRYVCPGCVPGGGDE